MFYAAYVIVIFSLLLFVSSPAFAKSDVYTSSSGIHSVTSVKVQGNSHVTVESETSGNSKTDIEWTENGETKKISAENEDVSYKSDDGSIDIEVQNNSGSSEKTVQPIPTRKPEATPSEKKEEKSSEIYVADSVVENADVNKKTEWEKFLDQPLFFIIQMFQSYLT